MKNQETERREVATGMGRQEFGDTDKLRAFPKLQRQELLFSRLAW
jgi:hypothetical protein